MTTETQTAAEFAEWMLSPEYRAAHDAAFQYDPEAYQQQREAAQELAFNALRSNASLSERKWDMRRQAALAQARGVELGYFQHAIHSQHGEALPSESSLQDLEAGRAEVVKTNSRILALNSAIDEPIDFLGGALDTIDERKRTTRRSIGPENYATALKFFADKYEEFPSSHLDATTIKTEVERGLQDFLGIADKDKPNFVEMTNVYFTIRALPAGMIDPKFTRPLLVHSLEQMPTYNKATLATMIGALGKMHLKSEGAVAADTIDLALRKRGSFDTTQQMRQAFRTTAGLSPGAAADRVLATVFEFRNNLEEPLDIEGMDDITKSLLYITRFVTENPELTAEAKDIAHKCAISARGIYQKQERLGDLTQEQLMQLGTTTKRIINNFTQI